MERTGGVSLVVGHLKWRYYVAAQLERVVITPPSTSRKTWRCSAILVLANEFNLAQRPLTLVAKYKDKKGEWGEWRWPVDALEVRKDTHQVTATLGPPLP